MEPQTNVLEDVRFWDLADQLVGAHPIVIDRPRGSRHPRQPDIVYPLDYGYLDGTSAIDGGGVDCWRGSRTEPVVTGAIVTVDLVKADCEIKWLVGCTDEETERALDTHRTACQAAILIPRHTPCGTQTPSHP